MVDPQLSGLKKLLCSVTDACRRVNIEVFDLSIKVQNASGIWNITTV